MTVKVNGVNTHWSVYNRRRLYLFIMQKSETVRENGKLGANDRECRENGGFQGRQRLLTLHFLCLVGS